MLCVCVPRLHCPINECVAFLANETCPKYVICRNEQVRELRLSNIGLSGTISPEIEKLSYLTVLNLDRNPIWGPLNSFPSSLSRLSIVRHAVLWKKKSNQNSFPKSQSLVDTSIDWSKLPELTYLFFSNNNNVNMEFSSFFDVFPAKLTQLLFTDNANITGSIPAALFHLSQLKYIDFARASLSGNVKQNQTTAKKNWKSWFFLDSCFHCTSFFVDSVWYYKFNYWKRIFNVPIAVSITHNAVSKVFFAD